VPSTPVLSTPGGFSIDPNGGQASDFTLQPLVRLALILCWLKCGAADER
jgi:hypothetical protein